MRVGYLGPAGTFTEEALLTLFGPGAGVEGVPYATVADCFAAVATGEVPQALVPMENSIEGSVPQTLDQLAFGPQGLVIKVQMIYPEPYWRADGLNGASLDYRGVVGETADSGVPERYSKKGIMTAFIYSGQARKVAPLPAAERRKLVLDEMRQRFGPKALDPIDYHEMNWSTQQWTRGCFTGFLTPGATSLFRSAVRDPVGPLHWAGTENATVWPSFIDGAIRSAERAVAEVQSRA